MDIRCATVMVLLLCGFTEGNKPSITWQILNPPIVFGEDVVLYCNASVAKHCCTNTATWMKDFDIIVHHGASIDTSKYIQKQRSDGFSLIITKFNEDDINHQYTCLYDFFSHSEVLKLNPTIMRYEPSKEQIKTNIMMSDNFIVADVLFEMIYPSPECNFVVNGEVTATNVTISEETRIRLFYKMKLQLICEIKKNKCIDSVAINCAVGGDVMVLNKHNDFSCLECAGLKCNVDKTEALWIGSKKDTTTSSFSNEESTEKTTNLPIMLASILTFWLAVLISVIIWRKKHNMCKANSLNIEGGDLQSTSSEMSCALVCCRHRTIINEESERIPLLPLRARSDTNITAKIINPPAQKLRHVTMLMQYAILNDKSNMQKMSSDTRIDAARQSVQTDENFNPFNPSRASTSHKHRITTNTTTQQVESNRMIFRVILEYNAFLEALNSKKRLKNVSYDIDNAKTGNAEPSLCSSGYPSSDDAKRSNRSSTPPAQKTKDVVRIVINAILHDYVYIQRLTTNIGINFVRCRMLIGGLNTCTCVSPSVTRKSEGKIAWVIGPAQKDEDVIKIVHYFVQHDKVYIQKLVTNTRINSARLEKSIQSAKLWSSSSVPERLNASTADICMTGVIKASSFFPSWGMKKRCRMISLTI